MCGKLPAAVPSATRTSVRIMDRSSLAAKLGIGPVDRGDRARAGRDPSTIAYWVNKHGLVSVHAESTRPRRDTARAARGVGRAGLSHPSDRRASGMSYATVQHWLRRIRTETRPARRRRAPRRGEDVRLCMDGTRCEVHGPTRFVTARGRSFRCPRCAAMRCRRGGARSSDPGRGGRRRLRASAAMTAPSGAPVPSPGSGAEGVRPWLAGWPIRSSAARAEARKCVLLCANCHAEVEAGRRRLR